VKFRTLVELGGKTATGLRVPPEVVAALGSGRKPAVMVTVGGYTYRSTVASRGEAFMIPLSAEHRGTRVWTVPAHRVWTVPRNRDRRSGALPQGRSNATPNASNAGSAVTTVQPLRRAVPAMRRSNGSVGLAGNAAMLQASSCVTAVSENP